MNKNNDSFITISDLWHLCVARWRWFVVSLIVCLLIATCHYIVTPNTYTRSASILVREESSGENATEKNSNDFTQLGFVNQKSNMTDVVRHITSLDVLMDVAHHMKPELKDEEVIQMAEGIQSSLTAEIEGKGSRIINLTYTARSGKEAENALLSIIQVYDEKCFQTKSMATRNTSHFIDSRLTLLERDLNRVDDSISTFKSLYGITDLQHVSDIYLQQQSQSDAEILKLTNQKSMAEYIRGLLNDQSSEHQLLLVNSGINNSIIESQITLYNNLLLQLQNHLDYTSTQNPLIVLQEKELSSLRKNILANINNHIRTIDIQLKSLEKYQGEAASKIASNPAQAKHLTSIEREQKVKESLYMYLLQKREENEISLTYRTDNTQIIDLPHGSDKPASPKASKIFLGGILLGILIPLAIIFLRATMDESVRDRFDIERRGDINFLGEVPQIRGKTMRFGLKKLLRMVSAANPTVVAHGKQDPVNEAFRVIRTKLESMTSSHSGASKIYLVTSNKEDAGKTFVAMNLALTLAIGERRVLFIDGDLRKASASRRWNTPQVGLSDYLDGRVNDIGSVLFHIDEYPTLDILPAGPIPDNPTELLRCLLFDRLIKSVRSQYEIIIIDSPAAGMLADAEIIEKNTDRSLFIIRAGQFERKRLDDLRIPAQGSNAKVQYVILNGVNTDYQHAGYRQRKNSGQFGQMTTNLMKGCGRWSSFLFSYCGRWSSFLFNYIRAGLREWFSQFGRISNKKTKIRR